MEPFESNLNFLNYNPYKIQEFLRYKREQYLNIGVVNRMRVNFNYVWDYETQQEDFIIYFYDYIRNQKYSIDQIPLKTKNMLIRLLKWDTEKSPYLDTKCSQKILFTLKRQNQLEVNLLQNLIKKYIQRISSLLHRNQLKNIQSQILQKFQSKLRQLIYQIHFQFIFQNNRFYQRQDCQFYLNMNFYGKCIGNLRFYIMRRPTFNQDQMYVFMLIIQPLSSKTKQIKFVFSYQDLIMIDSQGEVYERLKHGFTSSDQTRIIKLITSRIRMIRGLFGNYPILMSELQASIFNKYKLENQKVKQPDIIQKEIYDKLVMQRSQIQQQQQLVQTMQSPSNNISESAQYVRFQRPSLFSRINNIYQKDILSPTLPQTNDLSNSSRKSIFFTESVKQYEKTQNSQQIKHKGSQSDIKSFGSTSSSNSSNKSSNSIKIEYQQVDKQNIRQLSKKSSFLTQRQQNQQTTPKSNKIFQIQSGGRRKDSDSTFSQKLIDMDIFVSPKNNSIINDQQIQKSLQFFNQKESSIKMGKQINNEDQSSNSNIKLQQSSITPKSIEPIMSFLKTKKEVQDEIMNGSTRQNTFNNLNLNLDFNRFQNSNRSSNGSIQDFQYFKLDPTLIMRRTESVSVPKEISDNLQQINLSQKKSIIESSKLSNNQSIRNQIRKVSFVDELEENSEVLQKMSNSLASQAIQSQHGILKYNKQKMTDQGDQIGQSPKVHFLMLPEAEVECEQNIDSLQQDSPKVSTINLTTKQKQIENSSIKQQAQINNNTIKRQFINTNIAGVPNVINILSPKSDPKILSDKQIQDEKQENIQQVKDNTQDNKIQQEEILEKLKGQIKKGLQIQIPDKQRVSIDFYLEKEAPQSDQNLDIKQSSLNSSAKSSASFFPETATDIIFQDLRVFRNIVSRHDFSDGKQNIQNNKGFLETYMQRARIIGQYVRRMANNEYVLITVRKDFILKCWGIQIYIPKTQRVLLSQISHSELIDCSYDFLNKHISNKLRFFYENKNMKPFETYLMFLNRITQFSTNRMSSPDININMKPLEIQESLSNNIQSNLSTYQPPKISLLGSLINRLKKEDEIPAYEQLNVRTPYLNNIQQTNQTTQKIVSPKIIFNLQQDYINQTSNSSQQNENSKDSSYKTHIQMKDQNTSFNKQSSIETENDLNNQQNISLKNTFSYNEKGQQNKIEINKFSNSFIQDSNKSIFISQTPRGDESNLNILNIPQRTPKNKVSIIKLNNLDEDELKDEDFYSSNNFNRSSQQFGDNKSNVAVILGNISDHTPRSSFSSRKSINSKPSIQQNMTDSPNSMITKMIENSMRKGQRKLTFKIGQQQKLQRQKSQQFQKPPFYQNENKSSSYFRKSANIEQIINQDFEYLLLPKKTESFVSNTNQEMTNPTNNELDANNQLNDSNNLNQKIEQSQKQNQDQFNFILENNINIHDSVQSLLEKPQPNIEIKSQSENPDESEPSQFFSQNISESSNLSSNNSSSQLTLKQLQSQKKRFQYQRQKTQQVSLFSQKDKKSSQSSQNDMFQSNDSIYFSNRSSGSSQFKKQNPSQQRLRKKTFLHSNSVVDDLENVKTRKKTVSSNENSEKYSIWRQMKQSSLNRNISNLSSSQSPATQIGQKRNLKSLISQNQQKIVGERNLSALIDFMKPKQFEKISLQQKMQEITEEMDLAYMTGCPNERIERLVRYIEIKIWSNFLSQCEFRTDDKHFKVFLMFGNNRLSLQEQLFHEYVRIDQNNESVIEIDVELQESMLIRNRDPTISTRVQLLQYFFTSFRSIPYTLTSNFSFIVQNVIMNKGTVKKFNVNVRELLNLFIAEGFYSFQTNYMSSKVNYSEFKNLAYFLIYKIKSSNFLELMKTQEINVSIDKVRTKNKPQKSQQNTHSNLQKSGYTKTSQGSLTHLSGVKMGNQQSMHISSLSHLQHQNEKERKNCVILQDNSMMYYFEKVINIHLRLIMRINYFTRGYTFQVQIHQCGSNLTVRRNKTLKYFQRKIPFIQQFMEKVDLYDNAFERVCEFMKPKMILYFIIQHNLPLEQRYFKSITNTLHQRKRFSVFSSQKQISDIYANQSFSDEDNEQNDSMSKLNLDDENSDDLEEIHSHNLDDQKQDVNYLYDHYEEEEENEYFSMKSLSPLKFKGLNKMRITRESLFRNEINMNRNKSRSKSDESQNSNEQSSDENQSKSYEDENSSYYSED